MVTPGDIEREKLTANGVDAAKAAGAKFVMIVSVPTANTDSIFGSKHW